MFANRIRAQGLRQCSCIRPQAYRVQRIASRKFSASSVAKSNATTAATHPLAAVTSQLDEVAPRFEIEPSQIEILDSPAAFYETIKKKIQGAKRRIYLSTLYIGKTEHELLDTLKTALENNPELEVSILTDALRGTREDPEASCATLLASLVAIFGERVQVCMFHTPNLNGWKKKYMPKRINEGWGLQHMKLYGFDDEIMLSGANLSNDYFTNRLDRYHIFKSKPLADHYAAIHSAVCDISYDLEPSEQEPGGFVLKSPLHRGIPDPVWEPKRYTEYAKELLEPLIHRKVRQKLFPVPFTKDKTFVYPLAQFDVLLGQPRNLVFLDMELAQHTSTEKPVLTKLLTCLGEDAALRGSHWTFTAGYFNIDPDVSKLLIAAAPEKRLVDDLVAGKWKPCSVITASPWANGFYGSPGVSGMLPAAYTLLSRRFLKTVDVAGKAQEIQLKEWRRGTVGEPGGFTYHAKGIWATLPPRPDGLGHVQVEVGPSITHVGSSNYTKRSYSLDLEVGALVVTGNDELKQKLQAETDWLQKDASIATQDDLMRVDRRVGLKVRASLWLVEKLGGAL